MTLEEKIDTLSRFLSDDKASLVDKCLVAAAAIRAATEDEREACAQVADSYDKGNSQYDLDVGYREAAFAIGEAIRARGKK